MKRFHSARAAKEFLVSKIIEQAEQDSVPLTEVERKMLYFSETDWTLPDIRVVSEEFDRAYDQDAYERKIADLIRRVYERVLCAHRAEYDDWWSAVQYLNKEDHYLLVMVNLAGLRPRWDQLKLFAAGIIVATLLMCLGLLRVYLKASYGIDPSKYMPSRDNLEFLFWGIPVCLVIVYWLLRLLLWERRVDDFVARPLVGLSRLLGRSK